MRRRLAGLRRLSSIFLFLLIIIPLLIKIGETETTPFNYGRKVSDDVPWRLFADKITTDHDGRITEAEGKVLLYHGDDYLQADYARYFHDTRWVYLKGNVKAKMRTETFDSDEAEFDLANSLGWLRNGTIFTKEQHLYLRGELLKKTGENSYTFRNMSVTACDGETPAWSLTSDEGDMTVDGYARLRSPLFRILNVGALYSPYMVVPVKTTRQSGLLFPDLGASSRLGYYINLPYFQVIDDESDVTFYENLMTKRGFMQGVEFRTTPDLRTKGYFRFDWIYDLINAPTEEDMDDQFKYDGLLRPNHNRFWMRSKYDGHLPSPDWLFKFDIDYVSDQDYLREYKSGYSGFDASRKILYDTFGRDIDVIDSQTRTSAVMTGRSWDGFGLFAKAAWTQNLAYQNGNFPNSQNPTLQTLPQISAYLYKMAIGSTPLEIQADLNSGYYFREYGDRGFRMDVLPAVSLPLHFAGITLIPSFAWRQTMYAADSNLPDSGEKKNTTRGLPIFEINAFTEASRVFDISGDFIDLTKDNAGKSDWTKLRHSIMPRIAYVNIPNVDQDSNPNFDQSDRIQKQDEIVYSLTNILTGKRETVAANKESAQGEFTRRADYMDWFYLRLLQSYDRNEADRKDSIDKYPARPFSDIMAEASITPVKYLTLTSKSWFSPYMNSFTEHEHSLSLNFPGWGKATFGLDFQESIDEYKRQRPDRYSIAKYGLDLTYSPLTLNLIYRIDYNNNREIEKKAVLTYNHQCFALQGVYIGTQYEERVEAKVVIMGINFFGN